MERSTREILLRTVLVLAVVGGLVGYAALATNDDDSALQAPAEPQANTPTTSTTEPSRVSESAAPQAGTHQQVYEDGEYVALGSYVSPGGPESIRVTVTLVDDVITEAQVDSLAERPTTKQYQGIFIEHFAPQVVGKPIDEVHLSRVSGSSLTPKGFNEALDAIKSQATLDA